VGFPSLSLVKGAFLLGVLLPLLGEKKILSLLCKGGKKGGRDFT